MRILQSELSNQYSFDILSIAMTSRQKTITSFFAASPKPSCSIAGKVVGASSRTTGTTNRDAADEPTAKRFRTEEIQHQPSSSLATTSTEPSDVQPTKPSVNPEQLKRAHDNFLKAKLIQQCRKTPLLTPNFGLTWFEALEKEFSKEYFSKLSAFVAKERQGFAVYPPADKVFSWTEYFPIQETKVVILGQDPYHGVSQAHGLCFSVMKGVRPPPSLVNIFKELATDIPEFVIPSHGNLTGWARQGVLLLNAVLTVQTGKPNSHQGRGWEQFTDAVVEYLNKNLTGLIFILWGKHAQIKGSKIDKKRHHVLISAHPSPLSVTRFMGCKHFSAANNMLSSSGKKPIDWCNLSEE